MHVYFLIVFPKHQKEKEQIEKIRSFVQLIFNDDVVTNYYLDLIFYQYFLFLG